ncbi:zinc finger protein OZF-like [Bacillus rossius redtenbacheri]|uniref:zinc finger protein OZF-like n=1 Tax=Bacillus rossius redtenbacheri TaxID=93214 RepID=UPI002FDCE605
MDVCLEAWGNRCNIKQEEEYFSGKEEESSQYCDVADPLTVQRSAAVTYFLCGICETFFVDKTDFVQHESDGKCGNVPGENETYTSVLASQREAAPESLAVGSYLLCEICESIFVREEDFSRHQVEAHCPSSERSKCEEFEVKAELEKCSASQNCNCESSELCLGVSAAATADSNILNVREERYSGNLSSERLSLPSSETILSESRTKLAHRLILFWCESCKKSFPDRTSLSKHLCRIRAEDPGYKCNSCRRVFSSRGHLEEHRVSHAKETSCKFCGKLFSRHYLTIHLKTHRRECQFMCEFCGKCFRCKVYLKQHLATHSVDRSLECKLCGKKHISKKALRAHMTCHMVARPFKCSKCGKCFSHRNSWKYHTRTHTGERPFTCRICQKSFAQSFQLASHILAHTGEREFECHHCNQFFARKATLAQHIELKHS